MNELMFGTPVYPNVSSRKIHLEKFGSFMCGVVLDSKYMYTFEDVPKNIVFCRECAQKSGYIKNIQQHFKLETNKKKVIYTSSDTDESDSDYVSTRKKRNAIDDKNIKNEHPVKKMKRLLINDKIPCYHCQQAVGNRFSIYKNKIFHTGDCITAFKSEMKKSQVFDSVIFRNSESQNLIFTQWLSKK